MTATNPTPAPLSPERESQLRALLASGEALSPNAGWALLDELGRARAEHEPYEMLTEQGCQAGKHPTWLVDSEDHHACPWCEIDRLRAERHETNGKLVERDVALKAAEKRIAELEEAASAGMKSLSTFIFDTTDPGVDALGAQWLLQKVMPQADDPFAQPNRYRDEILHQAAKRQRDFIVSDDYVCDDWEAALDVADLIDPDEQAATSEGGVR